MIGPKTAEFRTKHARLRTWLKSEENLSLEPYLDSERKWTVGWGHLITDPVDLDRCRRGLKHLAALPNEEAAERLLDQDMQIAVNDFELLFSSVEMSEARRDALTAMLYQMGMGRFRTFDKMIGAVYRRDWERVYLEALDSDWGRKHKKRAARTAAMLRGGTYAPDFAADASGHAARA